MGAWTHPCGAVSVCLQDETGHCSLVHALRHRQYQPNQICLDWSAARDPECCKRPATGLIPLYGIYSLSFSSGLIVFLIWSDSRVVLAHCSVSSLKADQGFKKICSSASCFLTPAWLITFSKNKRNPWGWAGPESGSLELDQGRQQWLKWLPRQGFCKNLFKSLLVSREFYTWTVT